MTPLEKALILKGMVMYVEGGTLPVTELRVNPRYKPALSQKMLMRHRLEEHLETYADSQLDLPREGDWKFVPSHYLAGFDLMKYLMETEPDLFGDAENGS